MMKKLLKDIINIFLVIVLLACYFIEPMGVSAASEPNTLREHRKQLAELQAKKKNNENQKSQTQSEINSKKAAISNALSEIKVSEDKITEAKALIEETDKRILELKAKNEELMSYFQIMQGENVYLEFVTDSASMTELIMRSDAVAQLAEYQQEKLLELNDLITENEKLQVDLIKYEDELQNNIVKYQSSVDSLQGELSDLDEIGMNIDDEIRSKKELIKSYEDMGCGEDQDLVACASVNGTAVWYKPLVKGRVSSIFGQRVDPFTGKIKIHRAVDIAGNSEGTNVYSAGNGVVLATNDAKSYKERTGKKTCGGNQVYIQIVVAGKVYTIQYAHLLSINVRVGQEVNINTIIGTQGGGSKTSSWESCSTGSHLHFGVVEGVVNLSKYGAYTTAFNSIAIKPPGFPAKGGSFYNRTQWFS